MNSVMASFTSSRAVSAQTRERLNRSPAMMVTFGVSVAARCAMYFMQAMVSCLRAYFARVPNRPRKVSEVDVGGVPKSSCKIPL